MGTSEEKVLRFCLARVRAWSTEYCLYSTDPNAGGEPTDTFESQIDDKSEEPKMTQREMEVGTVEAWPSFDSLVECAEPVDTESVLESTDAPPRDAFHSPSPQMAIDSEAVVTIPSEVSMAVPMSGVAVQDPPVAAARRQALFAPLPSLVVANPTPRPKCKVHRLRLPRVVSQILEDLPAPWQTLSKEIETRVTRDGMRTLLVATSLVGEGATSVSCALACAMAEHTSLHILLVDADFRRPSLASVLQLPASAGIEQHLLDRASLEEVIASCDKPRLDILPTLAAFPMKDTGAAGSRWTDAIQRIRASYDLVIMDFGAVFASDAPVAPPAGIDATLVVRDPSKSGPELLDRLDAHFAEHGVSSLGVIENGVET
jgi:Mrp family chromosome partitioning ATPase